MHLRPYRDDDAAATRAVFERAVHLTASAHYTAQQVAAWAPVILGPPAAAAWAAARGAAETTVAVEDDQVVGFSDLVHEHLLDMLYVDPEAGGRGIGSALITQSVSRARECGAARVETYASLTARPLFERHGFLIIELRRPVVHGVAMTNFKMHLVL